MIFINFYLAGADIKEMYDKTFAQAYKTNFLGHWGKINDIKKPIIAAVNGFAVCILFVFFISMHVSFISLYIYILLWKNSKGINKIFI